MKSIFLLIEEIKKGITFETSRSSGKGGQHVNKTESRVTLVWNFMVSDFLSEKQKELIVAKGKPYVSGSLLRISTEESRSQVKNKKKSLYKLKEILEKCFKKDKPRKKTKIPKGAKEKRIKDKKKTSEVKASRKKVDKNIY